MNKSKYLNIATIVIGFIGAILGIIVLLFSHEKILVIDFIYALSIWIGTALCCLVFYFFTTVLEYQETTINELKKLTHNKSNVNTSINK